MGIKIDCKSIQENILEITRNNKLSHINYKLYIIVILIMTLVIK